MAPAPRVPRDSVANTTLHPRVGGSSGSGPAGMARTMTGGKPLSFVDGISRPQGRAAYGEGARGQNSSRAQGMGASRGGGVRSTSGYAHRGGAAGAAGLGSSSSGYGGGGMGGISGMGGAGGMGGMGGMYGMGMGMSMGMFPMMSGMLGNGLISRLYSLQYMVQSLTYMWHMAHMNSHVLVQAYHDALQKYQDILMMIRTSEFRRVIQRKCKKSRLFQFLFVVASSALAAAAVKLIQYYLSSPRNDLLTMGGMGYGTRMMGGHGMGSQAYAGTPNAAAPAPSQPPIATAAPGAPIAPSVGPPAAPI